jgi:serine/threonine protein kinase/ankyrin repeat protein
MDSLENLVGQILDDKYQIDRQLGRGGMGAVYKATHLGTERPVALKVIMPEFMEEKRFIERFKREAKAAGRLSHPNVVNVTDFGFAKVDSSQVAYLVMEYLDGSTLGDLLDKQSKLPLELIVDIIEQVSLAVNQAHKLGIVHRDLKPDNIWLQPNGRGGYIVKVLDFGLAQLRDSKTSEKLIVNIQNNQIDLEAKTLIPEDLEANTQIKNPSWVMEVEEQKEINTLTKKSTLHSPENIKTLANVEEAATLINVSNKNTGDSTNKNNRPKGTSPLALEMDKITQVGAVLGTPLYMSPEQCEGKPLDFRSDIYSLGVILYQMLSGSTPFNGKINRLLEQHIQSPPPPLSSKGVKLSPTIEKVVMQALEKDPSKRPSSTIALAAAFKANCDGEVPVIRQALSFYRRNFITFLKTSLLVYSPYLVFYFFLIGISLTLPENFFPKYIRYTLKHSYWILGIVALFIAHSSSLGIFALIVEKLQHFSHTNISLLEVLKTYFSNFFSIVITSLTGNIKVLLNYSLYSPIIILEKKTGKDALLRSEFLVNQLKPVMVGLQIRSLFISAVTLLAAPITFVFISILCFILGEEWSKSLTQKGTLSAFIFVPAAFILIPGAFLIITYPVIAIAQCLFYFKTKLILGESLDETTVKQNILSSTTQSKHSAYKRTVTFALTLVFTLVSWLAIKDIILLLAAGSGLTNVVEALIIVGANANSRISISLFDKDPFVTTPLIQALPNAKEKPDLVEILLKNGSNTNFDNGFGWTPLMEAVKQNDIDTVKKLISYGSNVNAAYNFGGTALMIAADKGNLEMITLLLNNNADINALNDDKKTALTIAITKGYSYIVKALLEKGAKVNTFDIEGNSPLSIAAENQDTYLIDLLIEKGADINSQNFEGTTPLIKATLNNNLKLVKYLVQTGANVNITDNKGQTALNYASNKNYLDILEVLKNSELNKL